MKRSDVLHVCMIAFALMLSLGGSALGDEVSLTLNVDSTSITMQDVLTATITLEGAGGKNARPDLPESPYFQQMGVGTSSNFTMINGSVSRSLSTQVTLMPQKPGQAILGPATVLYKGQLLKSNTVTVQIVDSASLQPQNKGGAAADTTDVRPPVFLEAEIEPDKQFLGAQITVSIYMYTRFNVTGMSTVSKPDFQNFWAEELVTPQRPRFHDTKIGDVPYRVALIGRFALFPLKTGMLSIEPFSCTVEVRTESGSRRGSFLFDDVFGRTKRMDIHTEQKTIQVLPLPQTDRPDGFQDVVGQFKMNVRMDKTRAPAGEPVTLEARVSGFGNFSTLTSPRVTIPEQINTYSETSKQDLRATADKVGGQKTYSMILVPRRPGTYDVGPVTLDYFDPEAKSYKKLYSSPIKLTVTGDTVETNQTALPITQQEVTASGSDIRYIRPDVKVLREFRAYYYSHPGFLIFVGIWPSLLLVVFVVRRYRKVQMADEKKLRSKRAGRVGKVRLKKARSLIDADASEFYTETTGAVLGFIADKTGRPASGIVVSKLVRALSKLDGPEGMVEAFEDLFAESDAVRFGGQKADRKMREEALNKARIILEGLAKGNQVKKLEGI